MTNEFRNLELRIINLENKLNSRVKEFDFDELIYSIHRDNVSEVSKMLHSVGVNIQNSDGFTPLMIAVGAPSDNVMNFLLDSGAHVNMQTNSGNTALMIAVSSKNFLGVLRLISAEANKLLRNSWGECAYKKALENYDVDIANLLINN